MFALHILYLLFCKVKIGNNITKCVRKQNLQFKLRKQENRAIQGPEIKQFSTECPKQFRTCADLELQRFMIALHRAVFN